MAAQPAAVKMVTCPFQRYVVWKPQFSYRSSGASLVSGWFFRLNPSSLFCPFWLFPARGSLGATTVLLTLQPSTVSPLSIFSPLVPFLSPCPFISPGLSCPTLSLITPSSLFQLGLGSGLYVWEHACCPGPAGSCVQRRSLVRTTLETLSLSSPLEIEQRCVCLCVRSFGL